MTVAEIGAGWGYLSFKLARRVAPDGVVLAEKRTKEIGVRKVLGSTVPGILGLLGREFAVAVVVANVLAWPAAWFAVHRWLEGFAYRSAPSLGTFLTAGLLALTMAMLSVGWRSVRAARANPVESLRYE